MKVYIAAPYAARDYVHQVGFVELAQAGHECTSTWATGTREIKPSTLGASMDTDYEDLIRHATGDLDDVERSDALIELTGDWCMGNIMFPPGDMRLHTGGRHVEFGYAQRVSLERSFRIMIVGEPENIFQRALCEQYQDLVSAIQALS